MKISIIIPVYNSAGTINHCIKSCIEQTYKDIEVICVDDGSKDASKEIIQYYKESDNRINYIIHGHNRGQLIARKTGLLSSTGDYVLFLDSDDWLERNAIEIIVNNISLDIDIVEFPYLIHPKNVIIYPKESDLGKRIPELLAYSEYYPQTIWNKLYSRNCIARSLPFMHDFFSNMAEDVYLSIIFASQAKKQIYLNFPIYNYSIGKGISTKKKRHISEIIKIIRSVDNVIKNIHDYLLIFSPDYISLLQPLKTRLYKDIDQHFLPTSNLFFQFIWKILQRIKSKSYLK